MGTVVAFQHPGPFGGICNLARTAYRVNSQPPSCDWTAAKRLARRMGAAATKTRTTKAAVRSSVSAHDAVLALLADDAALSLAELRRQLKVGDGGMTESQLTRTLRQLVDQGKATRPKRGYYCAIVPVKKKRAPRRKPTLVPAQRTPHRSESLARPLRAAPARPKRPKALNEPKSAVTIPEVPEAVKAAEEAAPTSEDRSAVDRGSDPTAEPTASADLEESAIPLAVDAEPVRLTEEAQTDVTDDASYEPATAAASANQASIREDWAPQARPVATVPAETQEISPAELAESAERAWLRRAALPVVWFALTGLALMFGGAIMGGLVGIGLGVIAVNVYRRERSRQWALERARYRISNPQALVDDSETLNSLRVH